MKREMDMAEVSDGKLYGLDDMVKADCAGCEGCHACCTGMGTSVVLDPFDAYRMTAGTGKTFETLLAGPLELNVVDGIILPNLKMAGGGGGLFLFRPEWTLQDSCVPPRDLPAVSAWKNLWGRRF